MNKLFGNRARLFVGPALLTMAMAVPSAGQFGGFGGFGGMGTGGGMPTDQTAGQSPRLEFRPWLSANGTYTDAMQSSTSATTPSVGTYGYGGAAGISGGKAWSRTALGGFYTGTYQRFANSRFNSGFNQVGALTVQHSATEKLTLFASQFMGSSNGGYGFGSPAGVFGGWGMAGTGVLADLAPGGAGFGNPGSNGFVDNEAFGTRVNFSGTSGGFTYRPNQKWSFGSTGTATFVRRKGNGLSDMDSYSAGGNVGYRLGQHSQVGAFYQYGQFSYPDLFGGNRVQQTGLYYTMQFGPQTTLNLMGGAYKLRTTFVGQVPMDPSLSGLLGQSTILSVLDNSRFGWTGSVALNRAWRTWSAGANYDHGINPGNGVILVSDRDNANAYVATNVGRMSLGAFVGYFRMSGLIQSGASTEAISLGANVGVRVAGDVFLGFSGGYSKFQTNTSANQWRKFASVNLTWSPSDAAFRF